MVAADQSPVGHQGELPLPNGYDWDSGPVIQGGNDNRGMSAAVTWGVLFVDGAPASAGLDPGVSNTRVRVRAMKTWLLSKRTGNWVLVTSGPQAGAAYREDFSGDVSKPVDARTEPDGVSGKLDFSAGRSAWHFWNPRGSIDPDDVAGMYGAFQARLILDDPNGPDDRGFWSKHLLMGAGIDFWQNLTAPWPNNIGASIGRFKRVNNNWRSFNTTTLSPEQLAANPPPVL